MNIYEKIGAAMTVVVLVFMAYLMFVIMPVVMYADAQCLKAGYPKAHVTVGLEMYCSNLQGTITVQVDKLK